MSDEHYLYRHYDDEGNLLYVGISVSFLARTQQHKENSGWFSEIKSITIEKHESREEAIEAERKAIQEESPLYNIQHSRFNSKEKENGDDSQGEKYDHDCTRSHLFRWVVNLKPLYDMSEAAELLKVGPQKLKEMCENNEIGSIVWRKSWHEKYQKYTVIRKITGWQIIDFLEYLENKERNP